MMRKTGDQTTICGIDTRHLYRRLLSGAAVLGVATSLSLGQSFSDDFTTATVEAVEPDGWQTDSSPPGIETYQVITSGAPSGSLDGKVLKITANNSTAPDYDYKRPKVRTIETYGSGEYQWRVYIPSSNQTSNLGANSALAAWLNTSSSANNGLNAREIDFEIGYGRPEDREHYGLNDTGAPSDALMVWMTIQPDRSSGTKGDTVAWEPANPADHFSPDQWYLLTMELERNEFGHYEVSWYIQKDDRGSGGSLGTKFLGRTATMTGYGEVDSPFHIYCSVEDFGDRDTDGDNIPNANTGGFIGTHATNTPQVGYFDSVSYTPPTGTPNLITDVSTDDIGTGDGEWVSSSGSAVLTVGEPAPEGSPTSITTVDGDTTEWHVNNPTITDQNVYDIGAFPDPYVDTTTSPAPSPAPDGNRAGEWTRFGVPFVGITLDTRDTTNGPYLTYQAKSVNSSFTVLETITETDGDVWISKESRTLTSGYQTYERQLTTTNMKLVDPSGGGDFDLDVKYIGFEVTGSTSSNGQTVSFDDVKFKSTPTGSLTTVTDVNSDSIATVAGIPPDGNSANLADKRWYYFGNGHGVAPSLNTDSGSDKNVTMTLAKNAGTVKGTVVYDVDGASDDLYADTTEFPLNKTVRLEADWDPAGASAPPAGTFNGNPWIGIRYYTTDTKTPTGTLGYNDTTGTDISSGPVISADIKYLGDSVAPKVYLEVVDADQEIWTSKTPQTLSTDMTTHSFKIEKANFFRNGFSPVYTDSSGNAKNGGDHVQDYDLATWNDPSIPPTRSNVLNTDKIQAVSLLFVSDHGGVSSDTPTFIVDKIEWNATPDVTNQSLVATVASWSGLPHFFITYDIPGSGIDMTNDPVISYQMRHENRTSGVTNNPTVEFLFTDGTTNTTWCTYSNHSLKDVYRKGFNQELIPANFFRYSGSGAWAIDNIVDLGWAVVGNGASSGKSVVQIDDVYWASELPADPPSLPVLTSIEAPDTTIDFGEFEPDSIHDPDTDDDHQLGFPPSTANPAFPYGIDEGTWFAFGTAYESHEVNINPDGQTASGFSEGERYLTIRADWNLGTGANLRFLPYDYDTLDLSGGHAINYRVRASNDPAVGTTTHNIVVIDRDGTIATSAADSSITTSATYDEKSVDLSSLTIQEAGNTAGLDLTKIGLIGIDFKNTTTHTTGDTQTFFIDYLRDVSAAPSGLTATEDGSSEIDLAWTDNSPNEAGFKIERRTGSGGTWSEIHTTAANATSYSDTGLSANTTYFYRVRSYITEGNSNYSAEASDSTGPPPPPSLASINFSFGGGSGYVSGTISNMPAPSTSYNVRTWVKTDIYYRAGKDISPASNGSFNASGLWGSAGSGTKIYVTLHPDSTDPWGTGTAAGSLSTWQWPSGLGTGAIVFGPFDTN